MIINQYRYGKAKKFLNELKLERAKVRANMKDCSDARCPYYQGLKRQDEACTGKIHAVSDMLSALGIVEKFTPIKTGMKWDGTLF